MDINVTLDEPLTSNSCVKLVSELLKYVLYQKQQIPFAYESLLQLQTKVKPTDRNSTSIKTLLSSLEVISQELSSQFHRTGCTITEVAIVLGATIISPKLQIRLVIPSDILSSNNHLEYKHVSRKPLLNLMRAMLASSEFQDALTVPLGLTNTFILVQKDDTNSVSDFFLPKPQYAPPTRTPCFTIKFNHEREVNVNCSCEDAVKVYDERFEARNYSISVNSFQSNGNCNNQVLSKWYQSREIIKGFKYVR